MEKFALLFRGGLDSPSPEVMQKHMQKWLDWVDRLSKEGKYLAGEPLIPGGKWVAGKNKSVTDGPFTEAKDIMAKSFRRLPEPLFQGLQRLIGDTIEERVRCFHQILRSHYSRSEYYTGIQIVSNLRKDPKTSAAALELIETMTTRSAGFLSGLRERVLPDHPNGPELTSLIFFAIRDFHIGTHVEAAMNLAEVYERRRADHASEEEVLINGLIDIAQRQSETSQEN